MKDFLLTIVGLLLIVAGFYAFQLIVLALFGLVLYYTLPTIKHIIKRRPQWK